MDTTIMNYPGFQFLPKGIKQMLLVSEAHFFDQSASHRREANAAARTTEINPSFKVFASILAGAPVFPSTMAAAPAFCGDGFG